MSFIGQKEIDSIEGTIVTFKDGTTAVYTETQQEYLVTDEEKDDTQLRDMLLEQIVPEIMTLLAKHNVKKVDVSAILQAVVGEYNRVFNIAVGRAFGTFEEDKHEAFFPENVRFSHMDKFKD